MSFLYQARVLIPLPDMPILGFSNSSAKKKRYDVKNMDKWDTIIQFENIVGKGEIACYEQFLLFPKCFQKLFVVDALKWVFME